MTGSPDTAAVPGQEEARILADALPLMQAYAGQIIVVKYGGQALAASGVGGGFARDIALLRQTGLKPVVVHGGGAQISQLMERLGIKARFREGLRVTGAEEVKIAEMVLAGSINKMIVRALAAAGARACGLSGSDGGLFSARPLADKAGAELGLVGEVAAVDSALVDVLLARGIIPVIAPIGADGEQVYNINADSAAGALAGALAAKRLVLLTDVAGILDRSGALISKADPARINALLAEGAIHDGMKPKAETCLAALAAGVEAAVILDGRQPHALLRELFTPHGAGTLITAAL